MQTQYIFCKKDAWDKIKIPDNLDADYEIWFYENHVKIESFFGLSEPNFPFYEFRGDLGDDRFYMIFFDGNDFINVFSTFEKLRFPKEIADFFEMNENYVKMLSSIDIPSCSIKYLTNRDFEKEKEFEDIFFEEFNESDWR